MERQRLRCTAVAAARKMREAIGLQLECNRHNTLLFLC